MLSPSVTRFWTRGYELPRGERGGLRNIGTLAVFPSFTAEPFGGVQVSGREAWRSITETSGSDADAFFYEPGEAKTKNVMRAMRNRARVDTLLVWHLGLLKLAPFLTASRRRLVLFLHGIEAWRKQDPLTSLLMRRTDLFLSNSDYTWKRFAGIHPCCAWKPHRTVHLGTGDASGSRPAPPNGVPSALMIGRMSKSENYKGHRETIAVWPRVLECLPEAELRIVGEGDMRPELERLVQEAGLESRIRFYGAVTDARKEELLRQCRVLVLPSAGEGFGLVYLEAMRMGRPSLVSNLDAGREVVNPPEAGLAVDLGDGAQFVSSMVRLLTPGAEWEQMSRRAQTRYEADLTARHFGERLRDALREA